MRADSTGTACSDASSGAAVTCGYHFDTNGDASHAPTTSTRTALRAMLRGRRPERCQPHRRSVLRRLQANGSHKRRQSLRHGRQREQRGEAGGRSVADSTGTASSDATTRTASRRRGRRRTVPSTSTGYDVSGCGSAGELITSQAALWRASAAATRAGRRSGASSPGPTLSSTTSRSRAPYRALTEATTGATAALVGVPVSLESCTLVCDSDDNGATAVTCPVAGKDFVLQSCLEACTVPSTSMATT